MKKKSLIVLATATNNRKYNEDSETNKGRPFESSPITRNIMRVSVCLNLDNSNILVTLDHSYAELHRVVKQE